MMERLKNLFQEIRRAFEETRRAKEHKDWLEFNERIERNRLRRGEDY